MTDAQHPPLGPAGESHLKQEEEGKQGWALLAATEMYYSCNGEQMPSPAEALRRFRTGLAFKRKQKAKLDCSLGLQLSREGKQFMVKGSSLTVNKNTVTLSSHWTEDRWGHRKNEINFNKGFHQAPDPGGQSLSKCQGQAALLMDGADLRELKTRGQSKVLGLAPGCEVAASPCKNSLSLNYGSSPTGGNPLFPPLAGDHELRICIILGMGSSLCKQTVG